MLTDDGTLYSRGVAMYGSTGHGGARDVGDTRCGGGTSTMVLGQKNSVPVFDISITDSVVVPNS